MNWLEQIKSLEGWHFGGKGSGIEDSLAALAVNGKKTATASWFESYAHLNESLPEIGHVSYVMNSKDQPVCVVEITKIETKKFFAVDDAFAALEGEGDLSLQYWRNAHNDFFANFGREIGLAWNPDAHSVVCEYFKVLHIF